MDPTILFVLTLLVLAVALLYSSVGQGGASGYLAAMALVGMAPEVMKPTALALNILVTTIAAFKFYRAQSLNWSLFWPFALGSVPFAFIGGGLSLPEAIYRPVVAGVLVIAGLGLLQTPRSDSPIRRIGFRPWLAILLGVGIGFLSGLTGVGGGIFLSPIILYLGWANARDTAGVSAAFIWVNSVAGLAGQPSNLAAVPGILPLLAATAIIGGWVGAEYGSRRLGTGAMQRVLATILVVAAIRMLFTPNKS